MSFLEKIIFSLNNLIMKTPTRWGWFHLLWIAIILLCIIYILLTKNKKNEKRLNRILFIYGITSFILELTKQIMWSFNYYGGVVSWNYEWYAAPFQLCTIPLYISLIIPFIKKKTIKDALLSFLAFYTILSSISVIIIPDSCFTSNLIINIHTMYLHCMAFVISMYIIINKEIKINKYNYYNAFIIFIICVLLALSLDILFYQIDIINGETFNMFYISPYFESSLPVFNILWNKVPYFIFLFIYTTSLSVGAYIIFFILKKITKDV